MGCSEFTRYMHIDFYIHTSFCLPIHPSIHPHWDITSKHVVARTVGCSGAGSGSATGHGRKRKEIFNQSGSPYRSLARRVGKVRAGAENPIHMVWIAGLKDCIASHSIALPYT
jgi:hypothetical protein